MGPIKKLEFTDKRQYKSQAEVKYLEAIQNTEPPETIYGFSTLLNKKE